MITSHFAPIFLSFSTSRYFFKVIFRPKLFLANMAQKLRQCIITVVALELTILAFASSLTTPLVGITGKEPGAAAIVTVCSLSLFLLIYYSTPLTPPNSTSLPLALENSTMSHPLSTQTSLPSFHQMQIT